MDDCVGVEPHGMLAALLERSLHSEQLLPVRLHLLVEGGPRTKEAAARIALAHGTVQVEERDEVRRDFLVRAIVMLHQAERYVPLHSLQPRRGGGL